MPFVEALRWGLQDKSGACSRVLGAGLTGALLLCIALLASRSAPFDPPLDAPVLLRVTLPRAATAGAAARTSASATHSPRRFSLVLGGSHHKTGTVQLLCLGKAIKSATGVRVTAQVGNVTASDVAAAAASTTLTAAKGAGAAGTPDLLLTALPFAQQCYGRRGSRGRVFRCPMQEAPCTPDGNPSLSLDGCAIHLPVSALGVWHFVRAPLDVVVSAYWFHQQEPAPEAWIDKEFSTRVAIMQQGGVPQDALAALGLSEKQRRMGYGDLLQSLPEETGIQLEFWRSAPGLYAMARQYLILQHHPAALQLQYEDAQRDFNGTLLRVGREFFPQQAEAVLEAAQQCNPATWSNSQVSSSNHVTAGKHLPGDRERLQAVLLAQPGIQQHLCTLTEALGYEEPRCGGQARRWRRQRRRLL